MEQSLSFTRLGDTGRRDDEGWNGNSAAENPNPPLFNQLDWKSVFLLPIQL
jgi:hypothetical protein